MFFVSCIENSCVKRESVSINKISRISLIFGVILTIIGLVLNCCSAFLVFAPFPVLILFIIISLIGLAIFSLGVAFFLKTSFLEKKSIDVFLDSKRKLKLNDCLKKIDSYEKKIQKRKLSIKQFQEKIDQVSFIQKIKTPWKSEISLAPSQDELNDLKSLICKKQSEVEELKQLLLSLISMWSSLDIQEEEEKFLEFSYLNCLEKETKSLIYQTKILEKLLKDLSTSLANQRVLKYEYENKIKVLNESIILLKHQLGLFKEKTDVEIQTAKKGDI